MERTVLCDGLEMDLLMTSQNFTYKYREVSVTKERAESSQCCLSWRDIIKAELKTQNNVTSVVISHIEQQKDKKLRIKEMILTCTNGEEHKFVCEIQEQCEKVQGRPKKVFVVINPIGGNCKGEAIYQKRVAPIFEMARIEAEVVVTERAKIALEIGENHDFTGCQGIITVGGDGIFQEIMQGYFKQLQKNAGIEMSTDNIDNLVKPQISFCSIPSGSSNGLSRYSNDGVVDCLTSTLRIVRGEIHHQNIITVYEGNSFLGTCLLGCSIGLICDFMRTAEEKRWMKKSRYIYALLITLFKKHRFFNVKLEVLTTGTGLPSVNLGSTHERGDEQENVPEWVSFDSQGKQCTMLTLNACDFYDTENRCVVDYCAPTGSLVVDTGCNNCELFKTMQIWFGKKIKDPIPNFHLMHNVKGIRFKILRDGNETDENVTSARAKDRDLEHYMFMDGEIVRTEELEVEARVLNNFVPMFSCIPTRE